MAETTARDRHRGHEVLSPLCFLICLLRLTFHVTLDASLLFGSDSRNQQNGNDAEKLRGQLGQDSSQNARPSHVEAGAADKRAFAHSVFRNDVRNQLDD